MYTNISIFHSCIQWCVCQTQESGVPTYRDGDGLWKRYDAMEAK